jgi:CSLREA domain-containing protein
VDQFADEYDGECSTDCSLRDAVSQANANAGVDTITLGSGTYSLTLGPGESGFSVDNSVGDLDVTDALTITGLGPNQTYIDASGLITDRVLQIESTASSVVISGVTLIGGNITGSSNDGGAISAEGVDATTWLDLTIINTVIRDNHSTDDGGGVRCYRCNLSMQGGGIFNNTADDSGGGLQVRQGTATLIGVEVISNTANGTNTGGGGVWIETASVTLTNCTIAYNQANGGYAGGIYVVGSDRVTINGGQVSSNTTTVEGGGLLIEDSSVTLNGAEIVSNAADTNGGGFAQYMSSSTFNQIGGRIAENHAGSQGGGIFVWGGSVALTGTQIVSNSASDGGGLYIGAADATLRQLSVLSNTAAIGAYGGGGIYNAGTTAIIESDISGNQTTNNGWGGGIFTSGALDLYSSTVSHNDASGSAGGGLYNHLAGTAVISRSVMYGNQAGVGGAVFNLKLVQIVNSTLSGNDATASGIDEGGGALFIDIGGSAFLTHTTIASNTAGYAGGINVYSGTAVLRGSLMAHNGTTNCAVGSGSVLVSNGYNLDDANTCGLGSSGDITGTDPLLSPLQDNGGPTLTHIPDKDSQAVDAIPAGSCAVSVDQRGITRPYGDGCDIGSCEFNLRMVYLPLVLRDY